MHKAITNTSPLFYLHRIGKIDLLPKLFYEIWTPTAVVLELQEGQQFGYDAPIVEEYQWLTVVNPRTTPSEWFALDLGPGELATMALALEYPDRIVILDDQLARKIAQAAELEVWGTLRILLEAKQRDLLEQITPLLTNLQEAGMWLSEDIIRRIAALAGEK